jgi:hypothetical protein
VEQMKPEGGETCVRVVCNSCLNPLDVHTARATKWGMHREWPTSLLQGSGEGGSEGPGENTVSLLTQTAQSPISRPSESEFCIPHV